MPKVALVSAAWIFGSLALLWLLSLKLRDSSIVDIFWGCGFVGVAWLAFAFGDGLFERRLAIAVLTTVWGGRLSVYLYLRNRGRPEDARYQAMRARRGDRWWLWSLPIVFGLQGLLMGIISLPLQAGSSAPLGPIDFLGAAWVLCGVGFEATADLQLSRFKAGHPGQLMTRGLWSWSRHPNYFGDFLVWWGLFAFAAISAPWTIVGPLVMSVLLMRVSGVTLLEQSMSRRAGWAEYARRTSAFFPRPPTR
jgi:steroid 5-alpha reductase family enzyme